MNIINNNIIKVIIIATILVVLALIIYLNSLIKSDIDDEKKEDLSASSIAMVIDTFNNYNKSTIIKTYSRENFKNFNNESFMKMKSIISNKLTKDIPKIALNNNKGLLKISFKRTELETIQDNLVADSPPIIKIIAYPRLSSNIKLVTEPIIVNDLLKEDDQGGYFYEIERYHKINNKSKESHRESVFIKINYNIDKKRYTSLFVINTICL